VQIENTFVMEKDNKRKVFKAKGIKTLQFVKINQKWKLSSVAWCDET